jgi:hypothetical protein
MSPEEFPVRGVTRSTSVLSVDLHETLTRSAANFINVLCTNFSYDGIFSSYVWLGAKNSYKKHAHKMLMKLTPDVNFTNILGKAFTCADPRSANKTVKLSVFIGVF